MTDKKDRFKTVLIKDKDKVLVKKEMKSQIFWSVLNVKKRTKLILNYIVRTMEA